jgi:hypothetical protein
MSSDPGGATRSLREAARSPGSHASPVARKDAEWAHAQARRRARHARGRLPPWAMVGSPDQDSYGIPVKSVQETGDALELDPSFAKLALK